MSQKIYQKGKIIRDKTDLLKIYQNACVPRKELMIGFEVERSGIFNTSLQPVNYQDGYLEIIKKLVNDLGWKIIDSDQKGNIFALKRSNSFIHTEADGRLELVSKPRKTLFALNREYQIHSNEINQISRIFGIRWIPMGMQPFAKTKEIKYCPKKRMKFLKDYFIKLPKGEIQLKKINGIHVNFGYTSEQNAIKKFQTIFRVAPVLVAMFANSPLIGHRFSGHYCSRLSVSQNFDYQRTSVKKEFFEENFDFDKWIDFVINHSMLYFERKNSFIKLNGQTFNDFLKYGFQGFFPIKKDFFLHLKSIWSEVRLKEYIEFRSFDSLPPHLIPSTAAIIKGLTLNNDTMDAVNKLMEKVNFEEYCQVRDDVNKLALQANLKGKKVLSFAKELLEIASTSLKQHSIKTKLTSRDESRFLWPIKEYVFVREQSPAEFVMEMWNGKWHKNPHKLLDWLEK